MRCDERCRYPSCRGQGSFKQRKLRPVNLQVSETQSRCCSRFVPQLGGWEVQRKWQRGGARRAALENVTTRVRARDQRCGKGNKGQPSITLLALVKHPSAVPHCTASLRALDACFYIAGACAAAGTFLDIMGARGLMKGGFSTKRAQILAAAGVAAILLLALSLHCSTKEGGCSAVRWAQLQQPLRRVHRGCCPAADLARMSEVFLRFCALRLDFEITPSTNTAPSILHIAQAMSLMHGMQSEAQQNDQLQHKFEDIYESEQRSLRRHGSVPLLVCPIAWSACHVLRASALLPHHRPAPLSAGCRRRLGLGRQRQWVRFYGQCHNVHSGNFERGHQHA